MKTNEDRVMVIEFARSAVEPRDEARWSEGVPASGGQLWMRLAVHEAADYGEKLTRLQPWKVLKVPEDTPEPANAECKLCSGPLSASTPNPVPGPILKVCELDEPVIADGPAVVGLQQIAAIALDAASLARQMETGTVERMVQAVCDDIRCKAIEIQGLADE